MDEGTDGRWTEDGRTDEGRKDGPGRNGPTENKDERTDRLTDWLFSLLSGWRKIPSFFYCKLGNTIFLLREKYYSDKIDSLKKKKIVNKREGQSIRRKIEGENSL